jgi:flagellar biosynthetic protein FliQ
VDLAAIVVDALRLVLWLTAPALGACVIVSLLMGVFQTATQANDASLGFVPKLFAVAFALFLSRDFLTHELIGFSSRVWLDMARIGN